MQVANARYLDPSHMRLVAEIDGEEVFFPADPGNRHFREVVEAEIAIAEYVPPSPSEVLGAARAGMSLSFPQLVIGLVAETWITEEEGEAWLLGALPAAVQALILSLPPERRFAARARASRPSVVFRLDPLVVALAAAQGKSPAELDTFFETYATVSAGGPMPRISNIPETFTAVPELVAEELWQVHDGAVRVSLEEGADPDRGIRLTQWQTIQIPAGKTVRYRRDGASPAVISREVIG